MLIHNIHCAPAFASFTFRNNSILLMLFYIKFVLFWDQNSETSICIICTDLHDAQSRTPVPSKLLLLHRYRKLTFITIKLLSLDIIKTLVQIILRTVVRMHHKRAATSLLGKRTRQNKRRPVTAIYWCTLHLVDPKAV